MMNSKAYWRILYMIVLCICSLILTQVHSEVIKVGGADRWSDSNDYVSWAEQYNFTVGDVLVFSYTPGAHNVYDVTKPTFQSCNTSTGVNTIYTSGDDQVVLKEAKQYWFICTVDNHCQVGMKLAVNVTAQSGNSTSIQPASIPNSAPRELTGVRILFAIAAGFLFILQ